MHNFQGIPWRHFMDFIAPAAERFKMLTEILSNAGLDYSVIEFSKYRHIIVSPPLAGRLSTLLVAHYDRAEGSPGANDNSAGVFILIETAIKLKEKNAKDWRIIFTDGEELKPGESIQNQGAYSLAEGLKNSRIEKSRIFCFDTCGRGDTMVISTTLEYLVKKEGGGKKIKDALMELRDFTLDTARELRMSKVLLAPTPFSDDVGFFRAGLAAQTITMLPSDEGNLLVSELRKNQEFAEVLINAELRQNTLKKSIPETWRGLNSAVDSYLRLTPKHFKTVISFAEALCDR